MIAADDHIATQLDNKFAQRQRAGVDGVQRVLAALAAQISAEEHKIVRDTRRERKHNNIHTLSTPHSAVSQGGVRPRHAVVDARQREIAEALRRWHDRVSLSVEDARSRLVAFHGAARDDERRVSAWLCGVERDLAPAKAKWALRVSRFTLSVMDDLRDNDEPPSLSRSATNDGERETNSARPHNAHAQSERQRRERLNSVIFSAQKRETKILTGTVLPITQERDLHHTYLDQELQQLCGVLSYAEEEEEVRVTSLDVLSQGSAVCVAAFHTLSALGVLWRDSLSRVRQRSEITHDASLSHNALSLSLSALCVCQALWRRVERESGGERERERHDALPALRALLCVSLSALRALAELRLSLSLADHLSVSLADALSTQWHTHSPALCESVVWWTHILATAPAVRTHTLTELCLTTCAFFAQSLFRERDRETRRADRVATLATKPSLKQIHNNPTPFPAKSHGGEDGASLSVSVSLSRAKALLTTALRLSALCATRYAACVGAAPQSVTALCVRDVWWLAVRDAELCAALDLAASAFALGLVATERERRRERESAAAKVLREAGIVLTQRCGSFVLNMSFVKCVCAAAMFVLKTISLSVSPADTQLPAQPAHTTHSRGTHTQTHTQPAHTKTATQREKESEREIERPAVSERELRALVETLRALLPSVLRVFAAQRQSLSVAHKCLLALRLLLRDVFVDRRGVEELFAVSLDVLLDPWREGEGEDDAESEGESEGETRGERDGDDGDAALLFLDQSLASSLSHARPLNALSQSSVDSLSQQSLQEDSLFQQSTLSQTSSHTHPLHTTQSKREVSVENYLHGLRARLFSQSFFSSSTAHALPLSAPAELLQRILSLSELVCYVVETHQQRREVLEQALLFVLHASATSSLVRFQFVETGLPLVVSRLLDTQPDDVYIVALGELCQETLDV